MKLYIAPTVISFIALGALYIWGGLIAFLFACLLSVLEVTLSFDNAVVNAKVLVRMTKKWQNRFLTWGILLAVFGTRFVLPILIVAIAAMISPFAVTKLAFSHPESYARLLENAAPLISAFGGTFLLMVSLKYFLDGAKKVHWITIVEEHLVRWGHIEAIEIALALATLLVLSYFSSVSQGIILSAGIVGILLFIIIEGIANSLSIEAKNVTQTGLILFLYLNVLDAAFSLDGVIGAFAITTAIPIIFVGLGIGAYFVRSMTIYLVRKRTLETLVYLEHGAHWAIFGLSLAMLLSLVVHIPEVIAGSIGLVFVTLAYVSSRRELKRTRIMQNI